NKIKEVFNSGIIEQQEKITQFLQSCLIRGDEVKKNTISTLQATLKNTLGENASDQDTQASMSMSKQKTIEAANEKVNTFVDIGKRYCESQELHLDIASKTADLSFQDQKTLVQALMNNNFDLKKPTVEVGQERTNTATIYPELAVIKEMNEHPIVCNYILD